MRTLGRTLAVAEPRSPDAIARPATGGWKAVNE